MLWKCLWTLTVTIAIVLTKQHGADGQSIDKELDDLFEEWRKAREKCQHLLHPLFMAVILRKLLRLRICIASLSLLLFLAFMVTLFLYHSGLFDEQITSNNTIYIRRKGNNNVITQDDIDYFSRNIQVNFTLIENSFFNRKLHQAEILLTNKGTRPFPSSGWEIYFSQPQLAEPSSYPYPEGVEKPKYGVRLFFLMGNVYRIVPTERFRTVRPGQSKAIRYISEHSNVALTDVHPNWYIAAPGLQARVFENTVDESLGFVSPYNSPAMWKRNTIPKDPDYDIYNPLTAADRYHGLYVEDMGTNPNPVLPTPAFIPVYNTKSRVNIMTGQWVVVASPLLANEAKYLCDEWRISMVVKAPDSFYIAFVAEEVQVMAMGRQLPTNEAYELRVLPSTNTITIKASNPQGAFYGTQTLLSLTDSRGNVSVHQNDVSLDTVP